MLKKNFRNSKAFSLVEVLVGIVILTLAMGFGLKLWLDNTKAVQSSFVEAGIKTDLNMVGGNLQKFMASGDIRFYGFTGNLTAVPPDRSLGRMLVVQPGLCRDLSSTGCTDDSAVLYIHYDKTTTPSVIAVCATSPNNILVDMANATYGTPTISSTAGGFNISGTTVFPTGVLPVTGNQLLATFNPPIATMMVATSAPISAAYTQDGLGNLTPAPPAAANCEANLQVTGAGPTYNLSGLVNVAVDPFMMAQFTSGTAVTNPEILASFGAFPVRIFAATIRSVGRMPDGTFGIRNCTLVANTVTCGGKDLLFV